MFLVKINATGHVQWAKRYGGISVDSARGITASPLYVFVAGSFSGSSVQFGTQTLSASTSGDAVWFNVGLDGIFKSAVGGGGGSPSNDEAVSFSYSAVDDAVFSTVNYFGPSAVFGAGTQNSVTFPTIQDGNVDFGLLKFTACDQPPACVVANIQGGTINCDLGFTNCPCKPGFAGDRCETNIDECGSNPCQHGGTCVDGVNSLLCICVAGYSGPHCEVDGFDECASAPCLNGATCDAPVGQNRFQCTCRAGFNGTLCQTNLNECASSPCMNGGVCVDGDNLFTCQCKSGFNGVFCQSTEASVFAIGAVAGGVAGAILFLILSLVCYFKFCRSSENKAAASTPKDAQTPANTGVI
jgi:Notch-like protein